MGLMGHSRKTAAVRAGLCKDLVLNHMLLLQLLAVLPAQSLPATYSPYSLTHSRYPLPCPQLPDAVVAIATTQVVLNQYHTFYARLVGNSFVIFSVKNYAPQACVAKVML